MIREYAGARDYLDDVTVQVARLVRRYHRARTGGAEPAELRAIAELELEADRADELIRARCAASHALGIELPLDRLRRAFALSPTEAQLVEVLVAFELAAPVRDAAAPYLDKDGLTTIELVEALVYRTARTRDASSDELVSDGRLFRFHIAELGGGQLPWLSRPIKIAPRVVELALGRLRLDPGLARVATLIAEPGDGAHLLQDPQARAVVAAAVAAQRERVGAPIPLLVGPDGAGRGALVHAVAHDLGLAVLEVSAAALAHDAAPAATLAAIARDATLFGALVVVRGLDALTGDAERGGADRGAPDRLDLVAATLAHAAGPVAVTARSNLWPAAGSRPVVVVELDVPSEIERETLWRRGIGDSDDVAERAAQRYRVTPGVIERAAVFARVQAAARSGPVRLDDVRVGVRMQLDRELTTLGRRITWQQTWDDVVLPDDVRAEIAELVARVRHRGRVLHDWGFARKLAKGTGVSALFSGPPGTGKTMVAALVAQELELDLYMIDASRMVSKWIGETEKNLARLFDAAAAGHVALLFDEADSLFARRTEVKSSTDRYANLEVNYLLQRMEAFEGITMLTTNLASSIDDAFQRRLAFRIAFPMPEHDERARLWRAMLPDQARVAGELDFDALAERFEMSGGYIRNAVVRAAYLAAAEGDGAAIAMRHLLRGGLLEYVAMGKVVHSAGGL